MYQKHPSISRMNGPVPAYENFVGENEATWKGCAEKQFSYLKREAQN
jgi:hypothetical protein